MRLHGEQDSHNESTIICELTHRELAWVAACCGETLEALDEWEFETRVGATVEEIKRLAAQVVSIYDIIEREAAADPASDPSKLDWTDLSE